MLRDTALQCFLFFPSFFVFGYMLTVALFVCGFLQWSGIFLGEVGKITRDLEVESARLYEKTEEGGGVTARCSEPPDR